MQIIKLKKSANAHGNIFEYLSLRSEVQILNIQKSKKIQEITPETCQNIEKMLILNSRYREIVIVEILILLSSYRGSIAIQGNYPKKCCHSGLLQHHPKQIFSFLLDFSKGSKIIKLGGQSGHICI